MADQFRTEVTADRAQFDATMDGMAQKALTSSQAAASAIRASFLNIDMNPFVAGMNSTFDVIKEGAKNVRGVLAGLASAAVTAGAFLKLTNDAEKATLQVEILARTLGITTQEASALKLALNDIGVTTDDYTTMVSKMTIKLRDGEERFNALGVVTRGANHELLNGEEIVRNSLSALLEFKEGSDRNLASTELFGRGWAEVMKLMRLTPEVMEAARVKAEELQTSIGPEGVERAHAYQMAMSDIRDTIEAVMNRIGQALMPVLTELGEWLSGAGPIAVEVTRGAIGGLVTAFRLFSLGVIMTFQIAKATIYSLVEPLVAVAEAAALAVSGDWSAAGDRLKQIPQNVGAQWKSSLDTITANAQKTVAEVEKLFNPAAEQGESKPGDKTGKTYTGKDKESMVKWEAELAAQRDAYDKLKLEQGSFERFTVAMERDYWKQLLDLETLSSGERAAVAKKYYDAERLVRKQAFDAGVADVKAQMAADQTTAEQKINLASRVAEMTAQRYGRESKEYKAALADMQKATDEWVKQQQRLRDLLLEHDHAFQISRLELERANLDTLEKLGQIKTKDKLARLKELKDIEYQIELNALQKKLELLAQDPGTNPVLYQEQLEKIEELKRRHAAGVNQIDNQMKVESVRIWGEIADGITGAFSTAIKGVIMGTQSIGQAFRNMGQSVALALIDIGIKAIAEMIKNAIIGQAISKTKAVAEITNNAAVAASAAAASVAAIPLVGWEMAPAVAAETFAATEAWAAVVAARGGFDIPSGLNPVTQLHQEEMVLPADIANPLRDSIAGGGGLGEMHLHVHAIDGRSVERFFADNGRYVGKAMEEQFRLFALHPRWR